MSPEMVERLLRPVRVGGDLFLAYLSAWPFLLLHVGLATFLVWKIREWKRANATERSDRSTEEETLRPYVGFFILIGIAGTFFGFFQFAVSAKGMADSGAVDLRAISTDLWNACANALPVGLFGILWTVVFHVWVDRVCRTGPSNTTHGVNLNELPESPEFYLKGLLDRLDHWGETTESLWRSFDGRAARIDFWLEQADQRATRAPESPGSAPPEMGALRDAISELTKAVRTRAAANQAYVNSLTSAATTAAEAVTSCASSVDSLRGEIGQIGKNIADALKKSDELAEQLRNVEEIRKGVKEATSGLNQLTSELRNLATDVKTSADSVTASGETVNGLSRTTVEEMRNAARKVAESADAVAKEVFDPLRQRLEAVLADVKDLGQEEVIALRNLLSTVEQISATFRRESANAFTGMAAEVRKATEPSLKALADSVSGLKTEVDDAATRIKEGEALWLEPLNSLAKRIEAFGDQSAELNRRLEDLAKGVDGLIARTSGADGIQVHSPRVDKALTAVYSKLGDVEDAVKLPFWRKLGRRK